MKLNDWVIGTVLGVIIVGVVTSCDVSGGNTDPDNRVVINSSDQRFNVTRHGTFNAGFDNNILEILIITDTTTKRTYLGITGVGVTEMRTEATGDENNTTTTRER